MAGTDDNLRPLLNQAAAEEAFLDRVGLDDDAEPHATGSAPAPTPSSSSVQPTSKGTLPGPNSFSPAPIAPLNPTVSPGNDPTQRP